MSEVYSTAFSLLFVGMITVFVVLTLVVITGKLLIRIVNRYLPVVDLTPKSVIEASKVAAITGAVDIFTGGMGRVTRIEKHN